MHLAELNENKICIGVKTVKTRINDGSHIEIKTPDFEYYIWRKYDFKSQSWSDEKYEPESTAPISEFENLQQQVNALNIAMAEMMGV